MTVNGYFIFVAIDINFKTFSFFIVSKIERRKGCWVSYCVSAEKSTKGSVREVKFLLLRYHFVVNSCHSDTKNEAFIVEYILYNNSS